MRACIFGVAILMSLANCAALASQAAPPIAGRWQYLQSPDSEGEVLDLSLASGRWRGVLNGLERAGEHGLFYYVVQVESLEVSRDGGIRFAVGERTLFHRRPLLSDRVATGDGGVVRDRLLFRGSLEGGRLVLRCVGPSGSCPDSVMRFERASADPDPAAPIVPAGSAGLSPGAPPFIARDCGISFAYPSGWEVVRDTTKWEVDPDPVQPRDACRFHVRPVVRESGLSGEEGPDLETIQIQVIPRGFPEEVLHSAFRQRDSTWVVLGRHDLEDPAEFMSGPGWSGVRGVATLGCYGADGTYNGLCAVPTALVGTSARCVLLTGGPRSEAVFDRLLPTLRFEAGLRADPAEDPRE